MSSIVHAMRFNANGTPSKRIFAVRKRKVKRCFPHKQFGRIADTQAYVKMYYRLNAQKENIVFALT